jgi:hypothetical protein
MENIVDDLLSGPDRLGIIILNHLSGCNPPDGITSRVSSASILFLSFLRWHHLILYEADGIAVA